MEAWLILGGLDYEVIFGGLDDVELVLELSCGAWSWRHVAVLFHILHASWSLLSLRLGFLKPLLFGTKRHKMGLVPRAGTLIISWC